MSKTPRTDEHLRMKEENGHAVIVSGDFARQLETELADARAEIEKQAKLIESMKNCQNCGREIGFCRHCKYAPEKRGWDDNWKEPI